MLFWEGETWEVDLSRGRYFQRSTVIDWIDCFPIFVLVCRL